MRSRDERTTANDERASRRKLGMTGTSPARHDGETASSGAAARVGRGS
jgi:hypothetical protein